MQSNHSQIRSFYDPSHSIELLIVAGYLLLALSFLDHTISYHVLAFAHAVKWWTSRPVRPTT